MSGRLLDHSQQGAFVTAGDDYDAWENPFAFPTAAMPMPDPVLIEARRAAYRLDGNDAAAALFQYGEVGPCPACEPNEAATVVERQSVVFHDSQGNPHYTPGLVSVPGYCVLCAGTFHVKAYLAEPYLGAPLRLSSYRPWVEPVVALR